MQTFPLTPNGKVDRRALPRPEEAQKQTEGGTTARNPVEKLLTTIWATVLQREQIGIDDNFFKLGGHSLLAMLVISQVREAFHVDVPLRLLFEAPTIAEFAERIAETRKKASVDAERPPALLPQAHSERIPLSFAQERLWFLDQFEEGSPLYNIPIAMHLLGALNVAALERSFNEIVQRHEVLRTTFGMIQGQPIQCIMPTLSLPLTMIEMTGLSVAERETQTRQVTAHEARRIFDLTQGPLVRTSILRLSDNEHVLLVSMHHSISDGWSLGIFMRELAFLYQAFCAGKPSLLAALPIQYADYAIWQRAYLQGKVLETHLSYWKEQLRGAPLVLELPIDRPRPARQTFRGARSSFIIPAPLAQALRTLSLREGVTLFMTLLASFATLLSRYTGRDNLLVGTPIANRTQRESEELIGFFLNTLVLHCDLSGDPGFRALLRRVREVTLGAYAHQELPFEQLVAAIQPQRDLSHTPLFQVMFVLENAPLETIELPGLSLRPLEVEQMIAKFDLTLALQDTAQELQAVLEYNTDLFEEATIQRMARHYQQLLESIVADQELPISRLQLLTEIEQQELALSSWNATQADVVEYECLHHLFEFQVEQTPDAIALVSKEAHLSYRELNSRANTLASCLQARGVRPDVLVGLCLEDPLELIIGVLGILKAGGAYLPLDPTHPAERLAFLLSDARVGLLLTREHMQKRLPRTEVPVLLMESIRQADYGQSSSNPIRGVTPQHLAYAIYTSGSTGAPKGVMVTHEGLANYLTWAAQAYQVAQGYGVLMHTSLSFDLTVTSLFTPLLVGQRLVIASTGSGVEDLVAALLQQQDWGVVKVTPAHLGILRQALSAGQMAGRIRTLIIGGEALGAEQIAFWQEADLQMRVFNEYGPTETVVGCCVYELPAGGSQKSGAVPIGRPIRNMSLHVLDAHGNLMPPGGIGEVYIGGVGLARGYQNQAGWTAEQFVPDPWSATAGARLYRTGDLARLLPDGNLVYLGRTDQQVKIHGFRVEPGEIEAALVQHEAVHEAVVQAQEEIAGDARLVAYIVPGSQQRPTVGALRSYLQPKLPDYMLPSAFVWLDELPLTPNGKLDWRMLPVPGPARPDLDELYVAPRTLEEEILVGIWSQVLKLERVSIHDNFFALGGDSIRSIQVLALAGERGLRYSLQHLFQQQTIAGLAHILTQEMLSPTISVPGQAFSLIASEDLQSMPDGIEDAYPLTMLQAGMFFHTAYSPESVLYHNVSSFHIQARFDLQNLQTAFQQIVARHSILRTSFNLDSFSQPLQLVHQRVEVSIPYEDLRHLTLAEQEQVIARVIEGEKERQFDWTQAPLLRLRVHHRGEGTFQLTLTEHHAILDGWSMASLLTEFFERYFALIEAGDVPSLEPLAAAFGDFVAMEQEILASEEARRYWTQKLSGSAKTVLPRWTSSRQTNDPPQLRLLDVPISHEVSKGLYRLARAAAVPLKSVLLAAHLNVLRALGGQADI